MLIKPMIDKPECKICKQENPLQNFVEDMLYSLFNPYHRDSGKLDLYDFLKKYLGDELPLQDLSRYTGLYSSYWVRNLDRLREIRKHAWQDLKEKIRRGEIKREDISMSQLVELFFEEIVEELEKMGYVESYEGRFHKKTIKYKAIAEKIIGDKILSIALENLEKRKTGEEITEKEGVSIFLSEKIVEFDESIHSFDNIDIVETFIQSTLKKKGDFDELVARASKHAEKCSYVMLIDISDSMRGKKIIGAIEAGIALKRAIKRRGNGELEIVAFNHKVSRIKGADIRNLE
ncbi:MAG: VWA domain-containing protein, partial [Archaeoglobaceae archaeon]